MSAAHDESSAICVCATCGTPMRVVFDATGNIKRVLAVCKCPRDLSSINGKETSQ